MTIQQTIQAIRAMGLSCNWNAEYQEFRVNYAKRFDSRWTKDSAYFTNDKDDAIATAKVMSQFQR